jgi:hypothetical protein
MNLNKRVIKDLKNRVKALSFMDISKNDIIRNLKTIYYSNITNKNITYDTYIEVTAYIVLLKSLQTNYRIR